MKHYGDWVTIKRIGEGGQGVVFIARKLPETQVNDLTSTFKRSIGEEWGIGPGIHDPSHRTALFTEHLLQAFAIFSCCEVGALKVLHDPAHAKNPRSARARFALEMEALKTASHPALIKLLEYNEQKHWLVTEYHRRGTLEKQAHLFAGDLRGALSAFRPVVEAVAQLHQSGRIHRDIKPANMFIADGGQLVLGDFGLAYEDHPESIRVTETAENVGSWQWMPTWAQGEHIEDPSPSFDVFCLGKTLWAMVSGKPFLRLHYYRDPEYDLEAQFPNEPSMKLANEFLDKCIVERQGDGIQDAREMLDELDRILRFLGAAQLGLEEGAFPPNELFPGSWVLEYRFPNGQSGKETVRIDVNGVYYANDEPKFRVRVISFEESSHAVIEKKYLTGQLCSIETLTLAAKNRREGTDTRQVRVVYQQPIRIQRPTAPVVSDAPRIG
jgi:serine/threonine protein kinase